jgi:hypothetical protein
MAARAALGRAFVASGATLLGLGAATMVVSSISMGIARVVVTQGKVRGTYSVAVAAAVAAAATAAAAWQQRQQQRGMAPVHMHVLTFAAATGVFYICRRRQQWHVVSVMATRRSNVTCAEVRVGKVATCKSSTLSAGHCWVYCCCSNNVYCSVGLALADSSCGAVVHLALAVVP